MGLYRLFFATVEHDAVTDEGVAPLITFRRDLHAHPEFASRGADRTAHRGGDCSLRRHGDHRYRRHRCARPRRRGGTGGPRAHPGRHRRLPVADAKDVGYRSVTPGIAHACGHDVHATVAVGVLQHFGVHRPRRGSVAAIFQPAEEIPFGATSGTSVVLADAAMAEMRPRAVLGVRCWPQLAAGAIGVESRLAMAAKDGFEITVHGTSAHVATPANGRDAILAASVLVTSLHAAVARRRDPREQVALNVGTFNGGTSQRALASKVVVTRSLRTHDEGVRQVLRSVIASVTEGVGVQFDTPLTLDGPTRCHVIDDPGLVQLARTTFRRGGGRRPRRRPDDVGRLRPVRLARADVVPQARCGPSRRIRSQRRCTRARSTSTSGASTSGDGAGRPRPRPPRRIGGSVSAMTTSHEPYRQMRSIRSVEEALSALKAADDIAGSVPCAMGRRRCPSVRNGASARRLRRGDLSRAPMSTRRRRDAYRTVCRGLGRQSGLSGGRGASPYFGAASVNFVGENSIVGAGVPIACGAALSANSTRPGG